ncbi:hypothetical protein CERSUDRAFT_89268 [Gelatoporia subvermispora B]|uniref:Uncharacterized protein n=1 Tax=Ceriporiopsis subvermispora (strain B) TaxID=914234 RepID=M2QZA1_CERS8|nr:hypothetical protein CERSUDRAFT_89268 [Gelatoporia subvermispora B]
MESLNLNILANSLPTSNLANAEKELTNNFKAAALSLTTLYRSSRRTSKRAYNAGYAAACQDLLLMIQQGVSTGESSDAGGPGTSIGRIMDYIEARLEAIKSREEEEDEDEERERTRMGPAPPPSSAAPPPAKPSVPAPAPQTTTTSTTTTKPGTSAYAAPRTRDITVPAAGPLTPYSPSSSAGSLAYASHPPSSPSPPPRLTLAPHAALKSRVFETHAPAPLAVIQPLQPSPPAPAPAFAPSSLAEHEPAAGTKRRHNTMLLESAQAPPSALSDAAAAASASRRRTRSARASGIAPLAHANDQNLNCQASDAMDVEEEGGRERKRVARR